MKNVITFSSGEIELIKMALATYENCIKAKTIEAPVQYIILDAIEKLASKLDIQERN